MQKAAGFGSALPSRVAETDLLVGLRLGGRLGGRGVSLAGVGTLRLVPLLRRQIGLARRLRRWWSRTRLQERRDVLGDKSDFVKRVRERPTVLPHEGGNGCPDGTVCAQDLSERWGTEAGIRRLRQSVREELLVEALGHEQVASLQHCNAGGHEGEGTANGWFNRTPHIHGNGGPSGLGVVGQKGPEELRVRAGLSMLLPGQNVGLGQTVSPRNPAGRRGLEIGFEGGEEPPGYAAR